MPTGKKKIDSQESDFTQRRKWQIALRRYVLEKQKAPFYAPYFGLDSLRFRQWIALQFDDTMQWENFGKAWQFDHIIPVACFDFSSPSDLKLCWNFINIRPGKLIQAVKGSPHQDVLTAKRHFSDLLQATGLSICREMILKLEELEANGVKNEEIETFLKENLDYLNTVQGFSAYEFEQLNLGMDMQEVLKQREQLANLR